MRGVSRTPSDLEITYQNPITPGCTLPDSEYTRDAGCCFDADCPEYIDLPPFLPSLLSGQTSNRQDVAGLKEVDIYHDIRIVPVRASTTPLSLVSGRPFSPPLGNAVP